jgi:hypothetical protein
MTVANNQNDATKPACPAFDDICGQKAVEAAEIVSNQILRKAQL